MKFQKRMKRGPSFKDLVSDEYPTIAASRSNGDVPRLNIDLGHKDDPDGAYRLQFENPCEAVQFVARVCNHLFGSKVLEDFRQSLAAGSAGKELPKWVERAARDANGQPRKKTRPGARAEAVAARKVGAALAAADPVAAAVAAGLRAVGGP